MLINVMDCLCNPFAEVADGNDRAAIDQISRIVNNNPYKPRHNHLLGIARHGVGIFHIPLSSEQGQDGGGEYEADDGLPFLDIVESALIRRYTQPLTTKASQLMHSMKHTIFVRSPSQHHDRRWPVTLSVPMVPPYYNSNAPDTV